MPTQVLPITDLAKAGVVIDTPSVSLPPNVFSDVRNVRFRDGAIRKMEGEERVIANLGVSDLVFIDWWPESSLAPDDGYYVVVARAGNTDRVYLIRAGDASTTIPAPFVPGTQWFGWEVNWSDEDPPYWQGTLFNGGFAYVLNNGISTPRYIVNNSSTPLQDLQFLELPGWDSYLVEENVTTIIWDDFTIDNDLGLDLGQFINIDGQRGFPEIGAAITNYDDRVYPNAIVAGNTYIIAARPTIGGFDFTQFGSPDNAAGTEFTATAYTGTDTLPDSGASYVWRRGDQEILMSVQPVEELVSPYTIVIRSINELFAGTSGATMGEDDDGDIITPGPAANVGFNAETGTHFIVPARRIVQTVNPTTGAALTTPVVRQQGVLPGDTVTITARTIPEINVRAGVLRSFGNLIVAGNLTETRRSGGGMVRRLPGLVRTSDVAAPGSIPANWNPFRVGVNTADEFTLSSTGTVQDMRELQGVMYVYTNESIHAIQQTGNPTLPFSVRPVSNSYGCQTIDAVQEFDGRHVVVGSNDIYIFQGHPGSITSIADARVRYYFFDDLNETHQQNMFTLLNRRQDEIWICYPSVTQLDGQCDKVLIWNYRDNTWTIREQTPMWRAVTAPTYEDMSVTTATVNPNKIRPLCVTSDFVFMADADVYVNVAGLGYPSYIERTRLAMTPEFTTENLLSIAMLTEGEARAGGTAQNPTLDVRVMGTDTPAMFADLADGQTTRVATQFIIEGIVDGQPVGDYKVDIREHGRLLNYRITDAMPTEADPTVFVGRDDEWLIAGLQFDIGSGGTR